MGADMILYCAPACDLTPEPIQRLEQVIWAIPYDDPDLRELMQALGYNDAECAKECIIERCQEGQYESRDTTNVRIPGCPYQIRVTGGLSWGEPPTEACGILEHVERCPPAWQILEEFAKEDFAAARESKPE
jgi:hypothetical protein